jgi:ankyrin repeat protein
VLEDPRFTALSIENFGDVVMKTTYRNSFGNLALLMNHSKCQEDPDNLYDFLGYNLLGYPLQAAAHNGDYEVVELLLNHRLSSEIGEGDLDKALYSAAKRGYEKVVELLLNHQLSSKIRAEDLGQALSEAAASGHEKVVALLLSQKHSSKISDRRLSLALECSKKPDVREKIQKTIEKRKATFRHAK